MLEISRKIVFSIKHGGKLFVCGNGGSATQASHFAGEIVGKFNKDRRALPAISLTDNQAIITAVANDFGYEHVFVRQLESLAKPGDILIGLSTSGRSKNVLNALQWATEHGLVAYDMPRPLNLDTPGVQEYHLQLIHQISSEVEEEFA